MPSDGEVEQRGAEACGRNHAQVDLHSAVEHGARPCRALGEDLAEAREAGEVARDPFAIGPDREQVDVADGRALPADAAASTTSAMPGARRM